MNKQNTQKTAVPNKIIFRLGQLNIIPQNYAYKIIYFTINKTESTIISKLNFLFLFGFAK